MNPIASELAKAQIIEMRRYACRTRLHGVIRPIRSRRQAVRNP